MTSNGSWHESPPPTSATPRTDRATYGPALVETARMLGVDFMGWQTLTLDRAMEHVDGRPAYREVDVSLPLDRCLWFEPGPEGRSLAGTNPGVWR